MPEPQPIPPEPFTEEWRQEYAREIARSVAEALPPGVRRAIELGSGAADFLGRSAADLAEVPGDAAAWMGKLFADPAGWARDVQQAGEETWRALQSGAQAMVGTAAAPVISAAQALRGLSEWADTIMRQIRRDPTLTLRVERADLEQARALHRLSLEIGEQLGHVGHAYLELADAAVGPSHLALPDFEKPWLTWNTRTYNLAVALHGISVDMARFMAEVLRRDGWAVDPPAPGAVALKLQWIPPRVYEIRISVDRLPGAVAGLEKAVDAFREIRDQILIAFQRLSTWEGYARLGYQEVADRIAKDLEGSLRDLIRVVGEARALPGLAQEVRRGLQALAGGGMGDPIRIAPEDMERASQALRVGLDSMRLAADGFRRGAGRLRGAWAMRPGEEAAAALEQYAGEAVARGEEIGRMQVLLRQMWDSFAAYLRQVARVGGAFAP